MRGTAADRAHPSPDGPRRLDVALVERGVFESRARAQAAIEARLVAVNGHIATRPSDKVAPGAFLSAEAPHPWASRGGVKLAAALDAFRIDPTGRTCLDVGASTGGFTDVLLARGAALVHAVDVGRSQLHPRLAADPRVVSHEGTDARRLGDILPDGARFDLVTVDLSFISVRLVLPALLSAMAADATLVILVKPQFEAGRAHVGRGGIVREAAVRDGVASALRDAVAGLGFAILGLLPSPITGGDGNHEFLLGARRLPG